MSELSGRQLALRWVLLIVAVIVSALAIRSAIRFARQPDYRDIPYTTGAVDVDEPPQPPVALPTDAEGMAQLLSRPDHEPTDAEPAALPPYPGGVNLMRFRRTDHRLVEHVSIWSISDADVEDVASFYQRAATDEQFVPTGDQRRSADVIESRYIRDPQLLSVRCRQAGDDVRVVLQLRYTVVD